MVASEDKFAITQAPVVEKIDYLMISPSCEDQLPPYLEDPTTIVSTNGTLVRTEKRIKSRLSKDLGLLVAEAWSPCAIPLPGLEKTNSQSNKTTVATELRFECFEQASVVTLDKAVCKLKVYTHAATTPWSSFPKASDICLGGRTLAVQDSIELASNYNKDIVWHHSTNSQTTDHDPANHISLKRDRMPDPSATYQPNSGLHIARLPVLIRTPNDKLLTPTFHSCLVSRTYILSILIFIKVSGIRSSVELLIPAEVTNQMRTLAVNLRPGFSPPYAVSNAAQIQSPDCERSPDRTDALQSHYADDGDGAVLPRYADLESSGF
jgi:hypothetical protein